MKRKIDHNIRMASLSPACLNAIGFTHHPVGHVEVPDFIRRASLDVWDGVRLRRLMHYREISLSVLCGIVLQSDPDKLFR